MFDFRPAISSALRDLLNSGDATIEEVLLEESCKRAFNSNDSALVSFISNHASEVLETAIFSENPKLASKALALFSKDNNVLVLQVIENKNLENIAKEVFTETPDSKAVSRFAAITQLACLQEPRNCLENCPYIFDFIPFCGYKLVLGMFEEFFTDEESGVAVQSSIQELSQKIKERILGENTFTEDVNDENAIRVAGYFKLLSLAKDSDIFKEAIRTKEMIDAISREFPVRNISVLDAQWTTVSQLVNAENVAALTGKVESLIIPLLSYVDEEKYFHQYQVSILNVLLVIAQADEQVRKRLIEINFHIALYDIISHFPHHTLAHIAVSNFIFHSTKMVEFEKLILTRMLPFCEDIMNNENAPVELRAFVWDLITKFKKAIDEGVMSDSFKETFAAFDDAAMSKIISMNEICESEYGGKLPEKNDYANEEDGLGNLSPEQIMQLLKFLTGGGGMRR